jgi:hypothetical protein
MTDNKLFLVCVITYAIIELIKVFFVRKEH